jgi:hypothetical protein
MSIVPLAHESSLVRCIHVLSDAGIRFNGLLFLFLCGIGRDLSKYRHNENQFMVAPRPAEKCTRRGATTWRKKQSSMKIRRLIDYPNNLGKNTCPGNYSAVFPTIISEHLLQIDEGPRAARLGAQRVEENGDGAHQLISQQPNFNYYE